MSKRILIIDNAELHRGYVIENQINFITSLLNETRIKQNVSLDEIMEKTGLDIVQIEKIESYNGDAILSELLKYCNCIGIDLPNLIDRYIRGINLC